MMRASALLLHVLFLLLVIACGGDNGGAATTTPSPAATTARRTPSPYPTSSPTLSPPPDTASPTIHPGPAGEPLGFPVDPGMSLGLVTGEAGARVIQWGAGPPAFEYTRDSQPSGDPDEANRSGWNCDVHVEYEGRPAVDWYIPAGTPIFATMEGTATLFAVTVVNAFDWYGVDREPYLGNPDRSRASIRPFPRLSGGLGVYVEIDSGQFLTVSAHLDLAQTAGALPPGVFYAGYSARSDYNSMFGAIPASRAGTPVAQWQVRRGDLIGYSGDAGYSEAPHLHYTIQRAGSDRLLCPTSESGFQDGGWLLK